MASSSKPYNIEEERFDALIKIKYKGNQDYGPEARATLEFTKGSQGVPATMIINFLKEGKDRAGETSLEFDKETITLKKGQIIYAESSEGGFFTLKTTTLATTNVSEVEFNMKGYNVQLAEVTGFLGSLNLKWL